jgi:hypothetical protein
MSWLDNPTVQVALISTIGAILVAVVGLIGSRMAKHGRQIAESAADVKEVKEQVVNSHPTNLRADLDGIREDMRQGFTILHDTIHDIRVDAAWERRERMDLSKRVDEIAKAVIPESRDNP